MVSLGSKRPQKKLRQEKFITYRSWRKYVAYLEVSMGEIKAGCRQRELQELGHMLTPDW